MAQPRPSRRPRYRPRRYTKDLTKIIAVRLSPKLYRAMEKKAHAAGSPPAVYAREVIARDVVDGLLTPPPALQPPQDTDTEAAA